MEDSGSLRFVSLLLTLELLSLSNGILSRDQLECPVEIVPERLVLRYNETGRTVLCRPTASSSTNLERLYWWVESGVIVEAPVLPTYTFMGGQRRAACYASFRGLGECHRPLNYTIYKTPDSVSVRSDLTVDAAGRLLIALTCDIVAVAPAKYLVVQWYHGNEPFQTSHMAGGVSLNVTGCEERNRGLCDLHTSSLPMNISATTHLYLNQTLNLAAVRCGALLNLDVSDPTEAVLSNPLNISIYYKPIINTTKLPKTIPVFQGYPEELVCEADGHPPPKIQWFYTSNNVVEVSAGIIRVTEPGLYNCCASNALESTYRQVQVILKEDYLPLIAGLVAVTVVVISIIFVFIYSIYYTNTKIRRYSLKNPKLNSHNGNVAHNGWDQPLPMTKLS